MKQVLDPGAWQEIVDAMKPLSLNEFRAWLEGYRASFAETGPTREQFDEILKRLERVAAPATEWRYTPYPGWAPSPPYAPPEIKPYRYPFEVWCRSK